MSTKFTVHHISTEAVFAITKFAANADNSLYFVGWGNEVHIGTPDIKYEDFCIIKPYGMTYTHGRHSVQSIADSSPSRRGIAEAYDVRTYIERFGTEAMTYGVEWDTANSSPDTGNMKRIGNATLHASLPVHSKIVGGLLTDDGVFTEFANQADWTQSSNYVTDGTAGQVMVRIPAFYIKWETQGTISRVLMSEVPIAGFKEVKEFYISAYEASLQRSTSKLASVKTTDTDYRGGNNNADWDNTNKSLLGVPATQISLTNFRTYARNRHSINGQPDTRWNCDTYHAQKILYWLFVVEYATLNSQKDFNAALTSEGYHQGGLGMGITTWTEDAWRAYNNLYCFIPCGITDTLGNGTGVTEYKVYDTDGTTVLKAFSPTASGTPGIPRYRGIEHPFGHCWKWVDGILVNVTSTTSPIYVCDDPARFASTINDGYHLVGNEARANDWLKEIHFGADGDITAKVCGGGANSSTYYCDHHWTNLDSPSLRGVLWGGRAHHGSSCGLAHSNSDLVPSRTSPHVVSRLCFYP
jgi:hypothetical protein